MKRLAVIAAALGLAIGVTACGGTEPPTTGTVVDRSYHSAYTSSWFWEDCIYSGDKYGQTTCIPIPETQYHPQTWSLELQDCTTGPKCRVGWRGVDQQTYNAHPVGSRYP